jgi:hypothetical protein
MDAGMLACGDGQQTNTNPKIAPHCEGNPLDGHYDPNGWDASGGRRHTSHSAY